MKKNFLFYILITIITLFSFNLNVNAAQELTCVYEAGEFAGEIKLVQSSDGTRIVYERSISANTDWIEKEGWTININNVTSKDEDGNLTSCPNYVFNVSKGTTAANTKAKQFSDNNTTGITKWTEYKELTYSPENESSESEVEQKKWMDDIIEPYTASCVYERLISDDKKHKIQINYGKNEIYITEIDPEKEAVEYEKTESKNYSGIDEIKIRKNDEKLSDGSSITSYADFKFKINNNFTIEHLLKTYGGNCPVAIIVERKNYSIIDRVQQGQSSYPKSNTHIGHTTIQMEDYTSNNTKMYHIVAVKGTNPETGEELTLDGIHKPIVNFNANVETCEELLGEDIPKYIGIVWNIVKIGIPIILLGMGTIDFTQAIFAGKEEDMKKAQGKFIKRIIIAVVIFIVPTLLGLLLNIAGDIWENIGKDICGILF